MAEALLLSAEHPGRRRRGHVLLTGARRRVRLRREPRRDFPRLLRFDIPPLLSLLIYLVAGRQSIILKSLSDPIDLVFSAG